MTADFQAPSAEEIASWDSARFQAFYDEHRDRIPEALYIRLRTLQAGVIYRETRALNLPKAPLHGGPKHKATALPMNALGKQGGYCFTNWTARKQAKAPARSRRTPKTCPHCGGSLAA